MINTISLFLERAVFLYPKHLENKDGVCLGVYNILRIVTIYIGSDIIIHFIHGFILTD